MKARGGDHLDFTGVWICEVNIDTQRLIDRERIRPRNPAARTCIRFVIGGYSERENERDDSKSSTQLH